MSKPSPNLTTTKAPKPEDARAREKRIRRRLRDDYEFYARKCLKIRTKSGGLEPFIFNRAQRYLDARAAAQKARVGYVRIIGLKGRQQGFSTYVDGRGIHITTHRIGRRAMILTHHDDGTKNLFGMTKRYYDNLPAAVKPTARYDNANELSFAALDSSYRTATAGGKNAGRSDTVQFLHWSEVAFSPNAEEHARGVLQTVPNEPDTEAWLESTSDGPGNYFHRTCMDAIAGKNRFEFVFVPWYWQEEYVAEPPEGFSLTSDEAELLALYGGKQADGGPGMSLANIVWRRVKISELGSVEAFTREYPNNVEEAFAASAADKLINPLLIQAAKLRQVTATDVWPIWGVDPAWKGKDDSALCKRQGNVLLPCRQIIQGAEQTVAAMVWHGLDTMALAGRVFEEFKATPQSMRPSHIVVDVIGIGAGVAHRLRELMEDKGWDKPQTDGAHPGAIIVALNVGEGAAQSDRFMRLRDELWWQKREWYEAKDCSIPDDEAFIQEESAPTYDRTSAGKLKVEDKDKTKKTLGRSPDRGDSFMHTFAVTPQPRADSRRQILSGFTRSASGSDFISGGSSGWMARM